MTLDASAIIAIVSRHPGWEGLVRQVTEAEAPRVPATALAEAGMVLVARKGIVALLAVSEVVSTLKLTVVPFTERDWRTAAREYYDRRESGDVDAARFGACLSAAVAARTGAELLTGPPVGRT
jgi:uncharacterized protein with PIN domain